MVEERIKYSLEFTADALLYKESDAVTQEIQDVDLFLEGEEIIFSEVLPVNSESSQKRLYSKVVRRLKTLQKPLLESFISGNKEDKLLILFYATCKTYTIITDFMLETVLNKWRNLYTEIRSYDFKSFIYQKMDNHTLLENLTPNTINKLAQVVIKMLQELEMLKNENLTKINYNEQILRKIAYNGDSCFLDVLLLSQQEKQYSFLSKTKNTSTNENIIPSRLTKTEPITKKALISGKHIVVEENEKNISYHKLFSDYLEGVTATTIYNPYIRIFYQVKNLMEFIQMVLKIKSEGKDITIKLITKYDEFKESESNERFSQLKDSIDGSGINFEFDYDLTSSFHSRSIETNTGWKISIDRGLDIFQPYDFKNPFNLANNIHEERLCKKFGVTYLKEE